MRVSVAWALTIGRIGLHARIDTFFIPLRSPGCATIRRTVMRRPWQLAMSGTFAASDGTATRLSN